MKSIVVVPALLVALLLVVVARGGDRPFQAGPPRAIVFQTRTMGTTASLTLVTADSAAVADLAYRALLSLHHTDSLLTNWTETSETARVNRLAGTENVRLDPELNWVLAVAARVGQASGGAFDLTVEPLVRLWGFLGGTPAVPDSAAITAVMARVGWPQLQYDEAAGTLHFRHPETRIDLGGVAKGYGVDLVGAVLRQAGVTDALIDLSGNMIALGNAPGRTGWTLGIMDPDRRHDYLARIALRDEAVATSGNYFQYVLNPGQTGSRRYGHILDPRTGWPADGMASATVIAADGATADAWATALVVVAPAEARQLAAEQAEIQAVLIEPARDGVQVIWVERSLQARFRLREGLASAVEVRYF